MSDMVKIIEPDSTQINADDFLSGPQTFRIVSVKVRGGKEQPVEIALAETGKFYRPCKGMCRTMVHVWGADSAQYAGKSLTLYCDPSVKWGGMNVGGIRISHMSHMKEPITMAITASRGVKKAFTVKPLVATSPAPRPAPLSQPNPSPDEAIAGDGAGHDVPLLTFEQGMSLAELLEEKLIPTAKLLAAAEKVTGAVYISLSQLPADFYERAVKWIEAQKSNRPDRAAQ